MTMRRLGAVARRPSALGPAPPRRAIAAGPFTISLNATEERRPDQEWVEVRFADGASERIRVQDYERVYAVPGLYEAIVMEALRCRSPDRVASMLAQAARALGRPRGSIRVLDLGAGNGVSGEALARHGLRPAVALDIEPWARVAALRDRPQTYEAYLAADLLALTPAQLRTIRELSPNALACVGAIGLGHVPVVALPAALELLADEALIAYTVACARTAAFRSEIATLFDSSAPAWLVEEIARSRYRHRFTVTGRSIWWEAVVLRARRA